MRSLRAADQHREVPEVRVARRAGRQFGAFSLAQALADGISKHQIRSRVSRGLLRRILPGVYVVSGSRPCWEQRLMAALLWAGPGAFVSGRSAARLLRFEGFERCEVVELTISCAKRAPAQWVVVHRALGGIHQSEAARSGPFLMTTATRTIFDLAGLVDPTMLEYALEDALRRGLTTTDRLEAMLASHGRQGVRGVKLLRCLLRERGPNYVPTRSQLEVRMKNIFKRCQLPQAEREHHVRLPSGEGAYIDFAYPHLKLGIEVDGFGTHGGLIAWEKDMQRENGLKELGWTILHFSWRDIRDRPDYVVSTIQRFLGATLVF